MPNLPVHECLYYVALPPVQIIKDQDHANETKSYTEGSVQAVKQEQRTLATYDNKERIRRKPSPISACEESMLRVVELDSTHTQASSKYFLSTKRKV